MAMAETNKSSVAEAPAVGEPAQRNRYVLGILLLIYILNYLDRQIINILAEPIKADLLLSDWELGLISGLAFALFYTSLGIPLARWADGPRNNRVSLISLSLLAWSGMTMVCAATQNFWQMMLARIGVGVGEAGCSPAAHSLISDVVPAERRATALGIYSLGIPIGKMLGMAAGGWIAQHYGWRAALLVVGAPGIALALLTWLTVKDPRLGRDRKTDYGKSSGGDAWRLLRRAPLFWYATVACSLTSFVSLGSAAFLGSFLIRVHELTVAEAGLWLGLSMGAGGMFGSWFGGFSCDRLGRRTPRAHMLLPGIASLGGGILIFLAVFAQHTSLAIALLGVSAALTSFWYGPVFSAVQGVAPPSTRATAAAVHLFVVNALGFGLGPTVIGALSDGFNTGVLGGTPMGLADGLRWAIAVAASSTIVSAGLFIKASTFLPTRRTNPEFA
ncbi:MFS transporter [Sphingomonas sp. MG17]|uniref:MFS transporter n=1 Tax=Sphingomonas tagetis TaxID=2949092 RepID=A0A9X2HUJ5_9SPHN|nr:MFS transporter [Sphingomonas tagetis]MCP3732240.1 MFS transporter [Sphingomonas tagetis]